MGFKKKATVAQNTAHAQPRVQSPHRAKALIEWSSKRHDVSLRLKKLKRRDIAKFVFTTQEGWLFTYAEAPTAWKRAAIRSGVKGVIITTGGQRHPLENGCNPSGSS